MIEKIVLNWLTEQLDVPVYMQEPESAPNPDITSYVVLEKTGSSMENHLFTAMIAVQSYAATLLEVAELNDTVKKAMLQITDLNDVTRVDLNSDYNFTDEDTKQPRYQAVFDLTYYERME